MPIDLEAIKARAEAATPPPWVSGRRLVHPHYHLSVHGEDGWMVANCDSRIRPIPENEGNVDFIAHAREDVPILVAEVEQLRAVMAMIRNDSISIAHAHDQETLRLRAEVERLRVALAQIARLLPATHFGGTSIDRLVSIAQIVRATLAE